MKMFKSVDISGMTPEEVKELQSVEKRISHVIDLLRKVHTAQTHKRDGYLQSIQFAVENYSRVNSKNPPRHSGRLHFKTLDDIRRLLVEIENWLVSISFPYYEN